MNGLWVTIGGDLRARRGVTGGDRGSSAGELWRGGAPRSSYKTSKVFKSHGPATRLAAATDVKKSDASCFWLLLRLCNTLDSQVKKVLVS